MFQFMYISESIVDGREQQAAVTVSYVVYHFSTSGIAVAGATGFTHPLGFSSFFTCHSFLLYFVLILLLSMVGYEYICVDILGFCGRNKRYIVTIQRKKKRKEKEKIYCYY